MRRILASLAALGLAATLTACPPADVSLDVTPMLTIHYIKPGKDIMSIDADREIQIEYTWEVGEAYGPPPVEMRAFVHFRDAEGNMIEYADGSTIQDDHDIVPSPSEWEPGMSVLDQLNAPDRKPLIFPKSPDGESYLVNVYMGLYNAGDGRRAKLKWPLDQPENRAYLVASFHVHSDREDCFYPEFESSWHGLEKGSDKARWSRRASVVSFRRYPRAEAAELFFSGHSACEDLEEPHVQKLRIYAHEEREDLLVQEFEFTRENVDLTSVFVPAKLYSNEEFFGPRVKFVFVVDRVIQTGGDDPRGELGFLLYDLELAPRNARR